MSTAGPPQGAHCAPLGGSAAAELANEAASVGAQSPSAALLDARGLHVYYGASHVLHGVDFRVG